MGRVRTKTVKRAARKLVEKHYADMTFDFHINKKILDEVALVQSKRLRNKIAGYATHLMKRLQKGPVKGISLKVQEEKREMQLDYVPDVSNIVLDDECEVDQKTYEYLEKISKNICSVLIPVSGKAKKHSKKQRE
eukprot:TRINITY_DN3682_c0_g1_i1.p1 TRINITY_DN3682_c0_g1~~TRINITY_DN3682_c0_g1_i1.p1  ORF type:complete len:135 (-),score=28.79 TRINITY_DN3682_c0_g1_i1:30-434(-)